MNKYAAVQLRKQNIQSQVHFEPPPKQDVKKIICFVLFVFA